MLAEDIFTMTMAMIDEMNDNGTLDPTTTAEYRAKTPAILTMFQNEIFGIKNRYRKIEEQVFPVAIVDLKQNVQVDDIEANTLLTNGLASHLMIHENKALASFYQERYEEMKGLYLKPTPLEIETREDVYDSRLSY